MFDDNLSHFARDIVVVTVLLYKVIVSHYVRFTNSISVSSYIVGNCTDNNNINIKQARFFFIKDSPK